MQEAGQKKLQDIPEQKQEGSRFARVSECDGQKPRYAWIYALLPVLGLLFTVWYIKAASADVIYSDYIRLVDAYLPDVTNPAKFFVPDLFTRVPAAFLQRLINVKLFGFSVTFDRLCTAAGLFLCGAVLAAYARRMRLSLAWYGAVMLLLFSLNKWEILLNGTAWAHVVSFGLFFLNYLLLDIVYQQSGAMRKSKEALLFGVLCLFPLVILQFAGEYIAAYAGVMFLACLYGMAAKKIEQGRHAKWDMRYLGPLLSVLLAFFIYLMSRHFAVWEHAGATSLSFGEAMAKEPLFLPRFFIKSFAGAVLGQETIQNFFGPDKALPDAAVLLLGLFVIGLYLTAIILYVKRRMYEVTLFPMILLLSGGMNHVIVTIGRWIFLKESYALSSRYSAQFMVGLLGILLIFGLERRFQSCRETAQHARRRLQKILTVLTVFILSGICYTTWQEMKKAPYREENYEEMIVMLKNSETYTAEELCQRLDWHKDPADLYEAIGILRNNRLNVFREGA